MDFDGWIDISDAEWYGTPFPFSFRLFFAGVLIIENVELQRGVLPPRRHLKHKNNA